MTTGLWDNLMMATTNATSRARAKSKFLAKLEDRANISEAAIAAGVDRKTVYRWRETDEDFAAAWDAAIEAAVDKLESHAWNRATEDNSDRMLEILLKGHRPEKYVERHQIGGIQ
jgi:hypothetical protein